MEQSLNSIKVAILVADGFEQVEMTCPRKVLNQKGATTHLISPNKNNVRGWSHLDWGEKHDVDVPLTLARADYYDALLLPGGVLGMNALRMNSRAVEFVKSFFASGKPVAAIGHGPQILIDADVVLGRIITSYGSIRQDLENAGARWVDQDVVTDNGLITSRTSDDMSAFAGALTKQLNLEVFQ
ncbi:MULTISPECIES: type 1 glutamine amidotransferase domain-containing protein [Dyadobacter]|uniref:Type 1 glutamine amidotransferase n=1 Tax=Dyadobacter chenhuakuii TaxID=2909339 RepID=A0ABY4XJT3_9BACT|nr:MULTISPECIES: type 1 glutamine amidotransferase domain-containing protein [Dyadobacter]MCE7071606.1 type 1 glutamine amidotransferase [Dyadobacter sp. CY327]MCF2493503.1 type 1 glutamine amidotransferase [Dyadobacter chenhuakuii]MCF2519263.1 type 1 glutamine amidotransferase [Dyadobacter sp. CY351]USJ30643.1 type 1 glutamine amidotransferase [Dyadobacter chenhuakuii]